MNQVLSALVLVANAFWESSAGQALQFLGEWSIFLGVVVAGIAAIIKLVRWIMSTSKWGFAKYKERQRVEARLEEITSDGGWPNGSTTLKASHHALYDEISGIKTEVHHVKIGLDNLTKQVESAIISGLPEGESKSG